MTFVMSDTDSPIHSLWSAIKDKAPRAILARKDLTALPTTGLAHDHIVLGQTGWLARLPKQSQMLLSASDNLAYQAACFQHCEPSGHTPRFHSLLPAQECLPLGGLIVETIKGRPAQLPQDLPAIIKALASIHSLPLPNAQERDPLHNKSDPLQAMLQEIARQETYVSQAGLSPQAVRIIEEVKAAALSDLPFSLDEKARCLISFDAHPGNFIINHKGRAILVDLEKCRYSLPGFDLAHATLYTSTTWDMQTHAILSMEETLHAYQFWLEEADPALAEPNRALLNLTRRLMWLWSITWCCQWRVLHALPLQRQDGQNWSANLSPDILITHVKNRVDHYLEESTLEMMQGTLTLSL
jgi:thiamine kinase-like enzyme